MGLVLMVAMAITGDGFFRPLELIGSVWYGGFTTGAAVVALGLITHLMVSALLGALWAYLFSYVKVEPLLSGIAYGAFLWAVMALLVLPSSSFIMGDSTAYESLFFGDSVQKVFYPGAADGFGFWMVLAGYLVFGLSLGAFEQWADRRQASRIAPR